MTWNPIWQDDIPEPPRPWTRTEQRLVALYALAAALSLVALCVQPWSKP